MREMRMSELNGDPNITSDYAIVEDEDDFDDEEYVAINSMLDQISSCLDNLEERNDSLNFKLHELLESNRQARQEFQAQLQARVPEEQPPPPSGGSPQEQRDDE